MNHAIHTFGGDAAKTPPSFSKLKHYLSFVNDFFCKIEISDYAKISLSGL